MSFQFSLRDLISNLQSKSNSSNKQIDSILPRYIQIVKELCKLEGPLWSEESIDIEDGVGLSLKILETATQYKFFNLNRFDLENAQIPQGLEHYFNDFYENGLSLESWEMFLKLSSRHGTNPFIFEEVYEMEISKSPRHTVLKRIDFILSNCSQYKPKSQRFTSICDLCEEIRLDVKPFPTLEHYIESSNYDILTLT